MEKNRIIVQKIHFFKELNQKCLKEYKKYPETIDGKEFPHVFPAAKRKFALL